MHFQWTALQHDDIGMLVPAVQMLATSPEGTGSNSVEVWISVLHCIHFKQKTQSDKLMLNVIINSSEDNYNHYMVQYFTSSRFSILPILRSTWNQVMFQHFTSSWLNKHWTAIKKRYANSLIHFQRRLDHAFHAHQ